MSCLIINVYYGQLQKMHYFEYIFTATIYVTYNKCILYYLSITLSIYLKKNLQPTISTSIWCHTLLPRDCTVYNFPIFFSKTSFHISFCELTSERNASQCKLTFYAHLGTMWILYFCHPKIQNLGGAFHSTCLPS